MSLALLSQKCSDKIKAGDTAVFVKNCTDSEKAGITDNCSPFCACSCCGTTIANVSTTDIYTTLPIASSENYHYNNSSALSSMPLDFWQPPRIV
jgi:hypothetical protein